MRTVPIRPILTLALALLMAATSVTMAVARSQPRAVGEVVICSGYAMVTIHVDAAGNRVAIPHACPDVTLAVLVPPLVPDLPPRPLTRSETLRPLTAEDAARAAPPTPVARGPPAVV